MHNPNMHAPLDEWLGTVVSLADGQHTITDLIAYLGSQYPAGPPDNLGQTIESIIERLVEAQAVLLADTAIVSPSIPSTPSFSS